MLPAGDADQRTLILDACTLINLAATGKVQDILAVVALPMVICDTVAGEALYLRRGGQGIDASDRDSIDLGVWTATGRLQIISAETDEELETFVDLAVALNDGEAMTIALAAHRALVVVTDDRKAMRLASAYVPVTSSLALVKTWIEVDTIDAQAARAVLGNIRERARYIPHSQHPLRTWWEAILEETSLP